MKLLKVLIVTAIMVLFFTMSACSEEVFASYLAATAPSLGAAGSYSVLAAQSANSANMTTISGNLGLSPGTDSSITGPWDVGGAIYFGATGPAADAQGSALEAYNNLAGQGSDGLWSGAVAPSPGVWSGGSSETFAGTLTLNGDYDDVWVFQISESLTFSGSVVMGGDAQPCHVFWQVGQDTTIASGTNFVGTLISENNVTLVSGATVNGRIMSLVGSVTVDDNRIFMPGCASAPVSGQEGTVSAQDSTESSQDSTLAAQQTTLDAQQGTFVPVVSGLPATGGASVRNAVFPLGLAVLFGGLSIVVSILIVRALRRNYQQNK